MALNRVKSAFEIIYTEEQSKYMGTISYQDLINRCEVLNDFAEARTQTSPNKDVILVLKKIDGQKVLQTAKKSEVSDNWNETRCGHDWNATLEAVAKYLEKQEPYLPSYSCLKNCSELLGRRYDQETINKIQAINKKTWKTLQLQKAKGYEVFKNCLVERNKKNQQNVYIVFEEYEKKSLLKKSISRRGIKYTYPNPMGFYPSQDEKILSLRYKIPLIESDEFLFFSPFFRYYKSSVSSKVLGFCYEYGLGAKKNINNAIEQYRKAADKEEFSACYNLGRLYLDSNLSESIKFLEKGKTILECKIEMVELSLKENTIETVEKAIQEELIKEKEELEAKIKDLESLEKLDEYERNELDNDKERLMKLSNFKITPESIEKDQESHKKLYAFYIKKWNKALQKIQTLLTEANTRVEKNLIT